MDYVFLEFHFTSAIGLLTILLCFVLVVDLKLTKCILLITIVFSFKIAKYTWLLHIGEFPGCRTFSAKTRKDPGIDNEKDHPTFHI